jgi:hypothetical protein
VYSTDAGKIVLLKSGREEKSQINQFTALHIQIKANFLAIRRTDKYRGTMTRETPRLPLVNDINWM